MKSERDLVCPNTKICPIYENYFVLATIQDDKIIKFNKTSGFFCYALREYSQFQEKLKKEVSGKDCALIQLLNNTEGLLNLSGKGNL